MLKRLSDALEWVLILLLLSIFISSSTPRPTHRFDQIRVFTRPYEFNFDLWTADAAILKLQQSALGMPNYVAREDQNRAVMESLRLTESILRANEQIQRIFSDPNIKDKERETEHIRAELQRLNERQNQISPLAEAVVESQVATILTEAGLTFGGQPIPPVLYHVTPLPMNLIISKREKIEQIYSISLQPGLSVDQQVQIEDNVANALNVSTLIVPVGGIGTYPTMVMRTDYFAWQIGTVIHEWTHNFLSLRPLGVNYSTSPEVRTMNETTASIVENELAPVLIQRYYPFLTASSPDLGLAAWTASAPQADPPPFDFRAEMHTTRVHADELLAAGKIAEAEAYMEARRLLFWKNGYAIRKLNQAYFAFYGAYADTPGGAAGEDPVGPAVRALRAQSLTLADFLNTISWMNSYDDLLEAIKK